MSYKSMLTIALVGLAAALPAPADDVIPGKFIVTLQPDMGLDLASHTQWVSDVHVRNLRRRGGDTSGVEKTFDLLHAYAGSFDDETLEIIKANSSVLRVEPDRIVHVASLETQLNPPWGLSAISNANPPDPDSSYFYDSTAGEGTFSYVVDSGVLLEHVEFEGRAEAGIVTVSGPTDKLHGTLVSAIVGGATYGVAKKTTLIDVTVVSNSQGSIAAVMEGLDWALNDIVSKGRVGKSVVNMSLSATSSSTFNNAVQVLIDAGVPIVAAAGNSNSPAANFSPANHPNVVTVGASSREYRRASFSNWGPEVDIFAPGVRILTASSEGPNATITTDGTSEASPHVAGVIAYLLGLEGPRTPAEVKARLLDLAIPNLIEDPQGSANMFLYNGIGK